MMSDCRRKLKCKGGPISGEPYFLEYQGQKIEHCADCASEVLGPALRADLRDVQTLLNTFGSVMDLGSLGGMRDEGGGPRKAFGWLAGVIAAFRRRQLWKAISSGRTLLGEAQYLVAEHMLDAISRMLPHASGFHKKKVERQLNHAKAKFEESQSHRATVQEYRDRSVMVPKRERTDFFKAAKEAYQNAKTVVTDLAPSFRSQKQRALLDPRDAQLLDILLKGVEDLKSGEKEAGETAPKPRVERSPTKTIADLPDSERFIRARKRTTVPLKKEQARAKELFEKYGGFLPDWGGFGSASKKRRRKTVKLAGADADLKAAEAALNGAVE